MTYYETPTGAKVFAAGAIDFGGTALLPRSRACSRTSGPASRCRSAWQQFHHDPRLPFAPCRSNHALPLPAFGGRRPVHAGLARGSALASGQYPLAALALTARNAGRRYAGDRSLFATISPGVPGRDAAAVRFTLNRTATVRLEAVRTAKRLTSIAWETEARLRPGTHELNWTPDAAVPVGSYVMRLTLDRPGVKPTVLGGRRPSSAARQTAPVVRVLGVEAAFLRRSYAPGEPMELRVFADAPSLTLQFLHLGAETESSERNDELSGAPRGDPVPIDWTGKRSAPVTITVQTGAWQSGVYAARLTTADGRIGFAPFVLRTAIPGARRQLVVHADEHVAGVQHVRQGRRRLGRHLVRGRKPTRRARPPLPRSGCAAALQGVRPGIPAVAVRAREGRRTWSPTTTSRRSPPATTCAPSTTSSSSRATAST